MAKVEGLKGIQTALRARAAAGRSVSVSVGYTAAYALYVHENLEARHPVGQAKFLEQPARELSAELGRVAAEAVAAGVGLKDALLLAGLRLQRESQLLCPVDTGVLRNSAFTEVTETGETSRAAGVNSEGEG